jgi:hypothetical protein
MMKLITNILLLSGLLLFIGSCQSHKINMPGSPINTQVNLTMENLEYIGEIKGTATQSYLLNIIPIGGRRLHTANVAIGSTGLLNVNIKRRGFNNALYDALMTRPDADFVLPLSYTTTVDRMFLGRRETVRIRAKAFKIITHTAE